jgi:V/A-type H+/Na+-transporting ATPase subunit E
MKSVEENIESLARAILSEAQTEAQQIKADAEAKAEAIRQRAQKQAEVERAEILERAAQEADRLRSQVIATTQLKARTHQLERREKMLDQVFTTAHQQLPNIQQWSDYPTIAQHLLREALQQLKAAEVIVQSDEITQKLLTNGLADQLSKDLNVSIKIGSPLKQGMGVVVGASNGRLQFENTLEVRLNRLQNVLRSPVYHILMGESL